MNFPIGGGGYYAFPLHITASAIRRLNEIEKQPAMVYVHSWEIDPDQPRMPGPWVSCFRHYQNLDTTEFKLERLLQEFSFCPMESVIVGRQLDEEFGYPI